jgi:hypothetical protein
MRGIPTEASSQRSCASMTIDLVAAAAHEPALLRSSTFRGELVLLLERYLRR